MLSVLTLTALAMAGPSPGDTLGRVASEDHKDRPESAVASAPASAVLELVRQIPIPPTALGEGDDRAALLAALSRPDSADVLHLNPDGALLFARWENDDVNLLSLPVRDDADSMAQVVDRLSLEPDERGGDVTDSGQRATFLPDGLLLADEALRPGALSAGGGDWGPLLAGLPTVPGCAFIMHDDAMGDEDPQPVTVSAFVPLQGGAAFTMRLEAGKLPAPEIMARAVPSPVLGTSRQLPTAVAVLSVPLKDLLAVASADMPADMAADFERLGEHVQIGAGLTLALFGDPREANLAAVVPVNDGKGAPMKGRKIIKGAKKLLKSEDTPFEKIDRDTIQTSMRGRTLVLSASDGRAAVGTNLDAVSEAAHGIGNPWSTPALAARAAEWPLAIAGTDSGQGQLGLGVRTRDGYWELEADLKLPEGMTLAQLAPMLGMAAAMAGPAVKQANVAERREEAAKTVDTLYDLQAAHFANEHAFVALPPAPRAPDDLDKSPVPWVPGEPWESFFTPDGPIRGAYWVEVSEDGASFTIHGMIDADGDGERAHFTRTWGEELHQLTAADIY